MVTLATLALASAMAAAPADATHLGAAPGGALNTEISVLTYNVRGLPWPLANGRAKALKAIGVHLAAMRRDGRQPDVVLIQEGFRREVGDLVNASGYRYWARGPSRSQRASGAKPERGERYAKVRYPSSGEGWGRFTGAGLHVLSDAPITDVKEMPYRYCAGFDCLANKGVMLARLAFPGAPHEIDIVNTHLNSRRAAKVPIARSLRAHNLQIEELMTFINAHRKSDRPLLVGGDFNVRNAPDRYDHRSAERPYQVVSEFCSRSASPCEGQAVDGPAARPWLRSQDLQAFASAASVTVRPVRIETVFDDSKSGPRLSDHDGYLVRYRLSWDPTIVAAASRRPPIQLQPQLSAGLGRDGRGSR